MAAAANEPDCHRTLLLCYRRNLYGGIPQAWLDIDVNGPADQPIIVENFMPWHKWNPNEWVLEWRDKPKPFTDRDAERFGCPGGYYGCLWLQRSGRKTKSVNKR